VCDLSKSFELLAVDCTVQPVYKIQHILCPSMGFIVFANSGVGVKNVVCDAVFVSFRLEISIESGLVLGIGLNNCFSKMVLLEVR
jgi:Na+/H+ antiporter NhaA